MKMQQILKPFKTQLSVTLYGKVDGKGDSFTIRGTIWGWSAWSRDELKNIKKDFEDSATASTLTEGVWSY